MLRHLLPCSLIVTAMASAQVITSPSHFTDAEGETAENHVIGRTSVPWRFLQVHDDLQGQPMTINRLGFRRDGVQHRTLATPAYSFICDVYVSTATTSSSTLDLAFDDNHGPDKVRAVTLGLVQVPELQPSVPVDPFDIEIPFQTPFQFPGNGPLVWEIRVHSRTGHSVLSLDSVLGRASTNPRPDGRRFGTGCTATGETQETVMTGAASANWTQGAMSFNYTGVRLPASTLVTLHVGLRADWLGPFPLPFTLPGTGFSPSGACALYNDVVFSLPALTQPDGLLQTSLGFEPTPLMNGMDLYAQAFALDAAANSWGVVATNSVHFHMVAPYPLQPVAHLELPSLGAVAPAVHGGGVVTTFQ